MSVDPLSQEYPWYTPYQFAGNTPIMAIDLDGLEEYIIITRQFMNSKGKPVTYKVDYRYISRRNRVNTRNGTFVRLGAVTANNGTLETQGDGNTNLLSHDWSKRDIRRNLRRDRFVDKGDLSDGQKGLLRRAQNNQGAVGSVSILRGQTILFEPDGGNTLSDVNEWYSERESRVNNLDNVAQFLVNVPGTSVTITGNASPTPTNIDGTESETSLQNNLKLSKQRAESTKKYLLNYIKNDLGISDFDESRISTLGKGTAAADEAGVTSDSDAETQRKYQSAEISIDQ